MQALKDKVNARVELRTGQLNAGLKKAGELVDIGAAMTSEKLNLEEKKEALAERMQAA